MSVSKKPDWLRIKVNFTEDMITTSRIIHGYRLHTVCEEAYCPNIYECWGSKTATFLILGDVCTRNCRFCSVTKGDPNGYVDPEEPLRVAMAVRDLGLKYVVITSVDRDDLPDGGASHYADTIRMVRNMNPDVFIEVLIPDFGGELSSLKKVVDAEPSVIGHNIETVRRLTSTVRDRRAGYDLSLKVLKTLKELDDSLITKSGFMLGLGETYEEAVDTLVDLRSSDVDIVTIGQYLMPSTRHFPVAKYVSPKIFKKLESVAYNLGFKYVASGPRVRSSYLAGEYFIKKFLRGGDGDGL